MDSSQSSTSSPMSFPSTQFSFKPPALISNAKHSRRISLPNSPRLSSPPTFRDDTGLDPSGMGPFPSGSIGKGKTSSKAEKRMTRKKWTDDETKMLVYGCEKHGVGNWKCMVEDPELKFDGRTAMDLKDRFRTHFNDSYRQLYPNARTHIAPTMPKPTAKAENNPHLFDKSRSRKRRPFTAEEDAALKAGYEYHGPAWATIVCHPVFRLQNRRSTDLRDRFRNAFPELYCKAGYKPRIVPKPKPTKRRKGSDGDLPAPSKPPRGRRATTSVLPDTRNAISDGELDNDEVLIVEPPQPRLVTQEPQHGDITTDPPEEPQQVSIEKNQPKPQPREIQAGSQPDSHSSPQPQSLQLQPQSLQSQPQPSSNGSTPVPLDVSSPPPSTPIDSEEQISSQPSPIPSWPAQDLAPSSVNMSADYFPPTYRTLGMIPKSAWGPQDWLSSNPRMDADPHQLTPSQSASSGPSSSFSPPHSYSYSHSQAVFDRYDLLPPGYLSSTFDFTQSEIGEYGGAHSAFSDADIFLGNSFRGFTHHSNTAGDLIFGTRSQGSNNSGNSYNRFQANGSGSVNPMQLHAIDERVESIRLSDPNVALSSGVAAANGLGSSLGGSLPLRALHSLQSLSIPTQDQLFTPDPEAVATPTFSQPVTQPPTTSTSPISSQAYPLSPRSMSLHSHSRQPFPGTFAPSSQDLLSQPSNPDAWNLGDPLTFLNSSQLNGFGEDIPFLDLHYWGAPNHPLETSTSLFSVNHTTGALDLAQSPMQRNHPRNMSAFTRIPQSPGTGDHQQSPHPRAHRPGLNHHRVQSAVAGLDFQPSYNNDNKRKRVSWDGGH